MSFKDQYDAIFMNVFGVLLSEIESCAYKETELWTSLNHIVLIDMIESTFNVSLSREDILAFKSYETGLSILENTIKVKE